MDQMVDAELSCQNIFEKHEFFSSMFPLSEYFSLSRSCARIVFFPRCNTKLKKY